MIRLIAASIALLAMGAVVAFFAYRLRKVPAARRWANLLMPASQAAIAAFILAYLMLFDTSPWLFALVVMLSVLCGIADTILLKALVAAEEKDLAQERVQILEAQMVAQERYREELLSDVDDLQSERQRIVQALKDAENSLRTKDVEAGLSGVQAASQAIGTSRRLCAHPVVAALLAAKERICEEQEIATSFNVVVPENIALSGVDLCAVFSNMLDNAIHACAIVEGTRFVEMRAHHAGGYLLVEIKNSYVEGRSRNPVDASASVSPLSREHGWGLSILQAIADRHEGSSIIEGVNGVFRMSVALKLDQ